MKKQTNKHQYNSNISIHSISCDTQNWVQVNLVYASKWWREYDGVGMFFVCRNWDTGEQRSMQECTETSLMAICSRVHLTSVWGQGSSSNRTATLSTQSKEWLWDHSVKVLEWPSQSPDLYPVEHFWRHLKMAVQRCSPNLMELKRFYKGEWEKLPKNRSTKLVASYSQKF